MLFFIVDISVTLELLKQTPIPSLTPKGVVLQPSPLSSATDTIIQVSYISHN